MTSPPISTALVLAAVSALVGRDAVGVTLLQGSVANQDFLVQLVDETRMVVKVGPAAELAAEALACRRLAGLALAVPEVVGLDLIGVELGLPTLILNFVTGSPSEDPGVAREAGRPFRRVHEEELPGWGPLEVGDQGVGLNARGRYDSWRAAILAELDGIPELVEAGVLDSASAEAVWSQVAIEDLLDYQGPGVLLHNDLKPDHLLGRSDGRTVRLSAVIDWGDAAVGDPVMDLARLSMAGPTITAAFLDGYGEPLTPALLDRLARYRILWNLSALAYEHRAGGSWFDTYRDRIHTDTNLLAR